MIIFHPIPVMCPVDQREMIVSAEQRPETNGGREKNFMNMRNILAADIKDFWPSRIPKEVSFGL